ncbi:MAG: hypothetical protein ACXAC2_03160 [Candidatus Kariarchaeaceae archaeon]|jgi:hypothetical protein
MATDGFLFDFEPKFFSLPKSSIERLSDIIYKNLATFNDVEEIQGLTIVRYDGKQPLVFSQSEMNFEYLRSIGETIASLEPVSYFRALSRNFEFKGVGHLNFDDFDLHIVKFANKLLLTIMTTDTTTQLFKICQNFADQLYELYKRGESVEKSPDRKEYSTKHEIRDDIPSFSQFNQVKEEKKPKKQRTPSKSDLRQALRSKLDSLKD